jgi:hypothetical protein
LLDEEAGEQMVTPASSPTPPLVPGWPHKAGGQAFLSAKMQQGLIRPFV